MESEAEEPVWQPSTDAQALADLRSLTRAYIRGELSHSAFVMQFGVQCLTHDVGTPRPPGTFPEANDLPEQWILTYPDGTSTDLALHNPSCGCDWCSHDSIGRYRGTPAGDTSPSEDKAAE